MSGRIHYLTQSQFALLVDWADRLRPMFDWNMAYLVGSASRTKDFRDVDVRLIVADEYYNQLSDVVRLDRLHLAVSIWGEKATGLPIDFQVQSMTEANNGEFEGTRNALFRSREETK